MNLSDLAVALTIIDPSNFSWTVTKDRNENEHLTRSDGLQFWLRIGGYGNEGKAAIHFDRPLGRDGRSPLLWPKGGGQIGNPSINVSLTKSVTQIAKDIVRRLLTESEEVFKLANESINSTNTFLDGKVKTTFAIAALCGTLPNRHYQSNELTFEVDPYKGAGVEKFKGQGYGKIKVSSEDSVDIELTSVGFDTAAEIVSAINKILAKRAAQA
jgi:hypothetical protein